MLVVLPAKADGLAGGREGAHRRQAGASWAKRLRGSDGDVLLPRFKTTDSFDLGDTLQAMGMRLAFSDNADFSGMMSARR